MLSISCDTIEIRTELHRKQRELPDGILNLNYYDNNALWKYKVTLDKMGVKTIKQAFENVKEVFEGAQTLIATRIDLKFDDDTTPYHEKYKLHRLLMSLAAVKNNIKNIYMDADYITGELISIKFDTDTREASYYNKERQKRGSGLRLTTIGRFEVRSKQLNVNLYEPQDGLAFDIVTKWLDYFREAANPRTYTKLKAQLNETIIGKYDKTTITAYLARYKDDMIFDRYQIKNLFAELGKIKKGNAQSADAQTTKFLQKYNDFEVIDLARVNSYLDDLQAIVANATEI